MFILIKHEWENLVLHLLWGNNYSCFLPILVSLVIDGKSKTAYCMSLHFALGSNFSKVHVTLSAQTLVASHEVSFGGVTSPQRHWSSCKKTTGTSLLFIQTGNEHKTLPMCHWFLLFQSGCWIKEMLQLVCCCFFAVIIYHMASGWALMSTNVCQSSLDFKPVLLKTLG